MPRPHFLKLQADHLQITAWSVEQVASQRLNRRIPDQGRLLLFLFHPANQTGKWYGRYQITPARLLWLLQRGWEATLVLVDDQWGRERPALWVAEVWPADEALQARRRYMTQCTTLEKAQLAAHFVQRLGGRRLPRAQPNMQPNVKTRPASRRATGTAEE